MRKKPIVDGIFEALSVKCAGYRIVNVRLGLRYVAVQLSHGVCGLAYRFPVVKGCDEMSLPGNGPLVGRKAGELLSWIQSANSLQRSIGLATANALTVSLESSAIPGDIRSLIDFSAADTVAMVGHFEPLVADIREQCSLSIFELDTSRAQGLESATRATEGLRNSDVALITSTSIINNTIDELLTAASGCREVVLLGPSTPIIAEVFTATPVTLLSGVEVTDDEVLRIVSEGGGMQQFKSCVRKVNRRLK